MRMTPLRAGAGDGGMGHVRIMRMPGQEEQGECVPGAEGKFRTCCRRWLNRGAAP